MASKTNEYLKYFFGISGRIFKKYDPVKIYRVNYWIYLTSGFWEFESPKQWKTVLYKVYRRSVLMVYGFSIMFFLIDAIEVRKDFYKLSFNMSSSVLVLTKVVQFSLLWSWRNKVEDMHIQLDKYMYLSTIGDSDEDKSILKQKAKMTTRITCMFYGLLFTGLPLRIIADTALDTRSYLIPLPFKEKFDYYYNYIYVQQIIVCFHFMTTTLAYDLLGFAFLLRYIGHYEILEKNILKIKSLYQRRNFEKYVRDYTEGDNQVSSPEDVLIRKTNYSEQMANFFKNYKLGRFDVAKWMGSERIREEKTFQLLRESISHHQKLLTELKNFSDVYSQPLLIQACGMAILIGIVTLQALFLTNDFNLMFLQQVMYASTTLMNIVYLCSFGSELSSKSISVANALYDTPWYDMSISNRNIVYLVMKKLVQAPELMGGKMININRPMCVKFVQFSYNIVALLRNKL